MYNHKTNNTSMNYNLKDLEAEKACLEEAQTNFEHEVGRLLVSYAKANSIPLSGYKYHIDFEPTRPQFLYNMDGGVIICDAEVVEESHNVFFHDKNGESYFVDSFFPSDVLILVKHILGIENANKED